VYAFYRCLIIGAEVEGVPSKSSKHHSMRHPSSSCHHHPNDNRADVSHADLGSSGNWSDPGSHAGNAATTLAPTASADVVDAKRQACEVHQSSSPMFAHSADPMDAEDLLCTMERELHTAQCNDREKVLYGPCLLRGVAQSWWDAYLATHSNPEAITWEEFKDSFCRYHVPEGLMIVRKEEFLAQKQGSLSVMSTGTNFCNYLAMHLRMSTLMPRGSTSF
jgi:hypothetical protein